MGGLNQHSTSSLNGSSPAENSPTWQESLTNHRTFPPLVKDIQEAMYAGRSYNANYEIGYFGEFQYHHIISIAIFGKTKIDDCSSQILELFEIRLGKHFTKTNEGKLVTLFLETGMLHPHDPLNCIPASKKSHQLLDGMDLSSGFEFLKQTAVLLALNVTNLANFFNSKDSNKNFNGFSSRQRIAFLLDDMNKGFGGSVYPQYEDYLNDVNFLANQAQRYLHGKKVELEA